MHSWDELLRRAELDEFEASLMPNRKCPFTSPGMDPCGLPPVPGLEGCWYHSGAGRDEDLLERGLQNAAQTRAMMSEAASQVAARLLHVAIRGEKDRDAVAAASQVLDRVGVTSRASLDVSLRGTVTHVDATPVLEELVGRLEQVERRRNSIPVELVEESLSPEMSAIPPVPPVPRDDDSSAA